MVLSKLEVPSYHAAWGRVGPLLFFVGTLLPDDAQSKKLAALPLVVSTRAGHSVGVYRNESKFYDGALTHSDLLPVRGRCLTKMLPVQTWHEREQEAEAIEFGDPRFKPTWHNARRPPCSRACHQHSCPGTPVCVRPGFPQQIHLHSAPRESHGAPQGSWQTALLERKEEPAALRLPDGERYVNDQSDIRHA